MRRILNFMMATFTMVTLAACQGSGVNITPAQTTTEVTDPGIVNSRIEVGVGPGVVSGQVDTDATAVGNAS